MSPEQPLENRTHTKTNTPLIVFGEVLYDCFPDGKRVLGGAPFNVAWGLKGLGQDPLFVSAVGKDKDGESIRRQMENWGMNMTGLQTDPEHPTGKVEVTIEANEPSYEILENSAWDYVIDQGISTNGLIYHGLLSLRNERSHATLKAICKRSSAQRFFDVNLRPPYDSMETVQPWLAGVDWLKLNLDELGELAGTPVSFDDCKDAVNALRKQYDIQNVLLTAGSQGARIIGAIGEAACIPAPKPNPLVDTVGAGDSFSVYTIHGILTGIPLESLITRASKFASKVCGLQGATTDEVNFYH
ncbi:MAG: carbohydrate kinase [Verrucomicrobia bacterium]|nr:carbohydrate kinase [Verrucomicrobiota bacterium]MDA1066815.1 carbohydrate kinase [Verrucomicrobiota bacterium]